MTKRSNEGCDRHMGKTTHGGPFSAFGRMNNMQIQVDMCTYTYRCADTCFCQNAKNTGRGTLKPRVRKTSDSCTAKAFFFFVIEHLTNEQHLDK